MNRIDQAQIKFTDIYDRKLWGQGAQGRNVEFTISNIYDYVSMIEKFIRENEVKSVVEFGCGAWAHPRFIDWDNLEYDGYDVVASLIEENNQQFGADNIRFHSVSDGMKLPAADLLISKTVFQHLPTGDVKYYLSVFKRLYKFMLITDDVIPDDNLNGEIETGGYRALRLDRPPFNERCAVVQRMSGSNFGVHWVKHTYLLCGEPEASRGSGIALTNL
jgi:hypothetical protein